MMNVTWPGLFSRATACAVITLALGASAFAQTPPRPPAGRTAPPPAAPTAPPAGGPGGETVVQLKGDPAQTDWLKRCGKDERANKEVCLTVREFVTDQGQPVLAVAVYDMQGDPNKIVRLMMPPGLMLRPGVRLSADGKFLTFPSGDNKGKPVTAEFTICMQERCFAEVPMGDELMRSVKRTGMLSLSVQNSAARVLTFNIPFDGFGKAFDGAAVDPEELKKREEALKAQLEGQADALKRRLQQQREGQPPAEAPKP